MEEAGALQRERGCGERLRGRGERLGLGLGVRKIVEHIDTMDEKEWRAEREREIWERERL